LVTIARYWLNLVQNNDDGYRVKLLRTDDGTEYAGLLTPILEVNGIERPPPSRYTPEINGVTERANRETMRALLLQANIPYRFWADAVRTAVFVRNMVPHSSLPHNATPYERWHGEPPDYYMLKPFGCLVWTHVPKQVRRKQGKLGQSGTKVQAMGADGCFIEHISSTQYKVYSFTSRKYFVTDNLQFREDQFLESSRFDPPSSISTSIQNLSPSTAQSLPPPIVHDMIIVQPPPAITAPEVIIQANEPITYDEAMSRSDAKE
jgi:hypothetical protein